MEVIITIAVVAFALLGLWLLLTGDDSDHLKFN
jgi:hypothetical protein